LANASVTNPKLASGSVLSANIGAGAVATPNIADQAVTTPKIAPGAVSVVSTKVFSSVIVQPGGADFETLAVCPSGTTLTGGGFALPTPNLVVQINAPADLHGGSNNAWEVDALNTGAFPDQLNGFAECATIHP